VRGKSEDRRAEIADAILGVVGKEGVGALTMERLGREVGVTSGALFRHFPSRAAMLDEAARRAVALLETSFPAPELAPLERLRAFLTARSRLASQHPGIPQLVFSEQFGKALPPEGARALRDMVLRTRGFVVEALKEAGARGEVRRDLPPEELAVVVMGAMFARAVLGAAGRDGASRRTKVAAGWSSLLRLLTPPAHAPDRRAGRPESPVTEGGNP
jgi:AcrR family transcriptional regulator